MSILFSFLFIALAFCLIAAFLAALAVGIGFVLTACVPALQLGHAIIAGAIVAPATLYYFRRLLNAINDMSEGENEDGIPDDHPVVVLPKDFLYRFPGRSKTRKKRK